MTDPLRRVGADSPARQGLVWLSLACVLYALVCGSLVVVHWQRWQTGADTGVYTQVALNAFHGFRSAFEDGSDFGVHFSPLLAIFYPLVALTHTGLSLELAQVVLIAIVPLALYAFVLPHADDKLAMLAGFIALLYPPLAAIGLSDFHILACVPLLIIGLAWAADRGQWGWFAAFGIAALSVREDVLLEFAVIGVAGGIAMLRATAGIGSLFDAPERRHAAGIAMLALGGTAVALACAFFGIIQPANSRYGWYPLLYYHIGARPRSGVIAQPPVPPPPNPQNSPLASALQRVTYLLEAFVPLAFLPLRSRWWLLALPGLFIVLVADAQSIRTMGSQYSLLWAPWLVLATAIALIYLFSAAGPQAAKAWATASIAACLVFLVAFNPMHLSYYLRPPYHGLGAARRALACVPPEASFSTHDAWFTQVAGTRPRATGDVIAGVDYLVYADDYPDETFQKEIKPQLDAAVATGRAHAACVVDAVRVYQVR